MAQNFTTPVTRALNKEFGQLGFRCQFSQAGSFWAVRIDDPEGRVTVRQAHWVAEFATNLLKENGFIDVGVRPVSNGWHFDGVVINWERK